MISFLLQGALLAATAATIGAAAQAEVSAIPDGAWPYMASGVAALWVVNAFLTHMGRQRIAKGSQEILEALALRQSRMERNISAMKDETHDLHQWHDQRDEQGVPVWYGASASRAFERLSASIDRLADLVKSREPGGKF